MADDERDGVLLSLHCRRRHPREEVRAIATKIGTRWRCLSSLRGAAASRQARDAFGRTISEANRDEARRKAKPVLRQPEPGAGSFRQRSSEAPAGELNFC